MIEDDIPFSEVRARFTRSFTKARLSFPLVDSVGKFILMKADTLRGQIKDDAELNETLSLWLKQANREIP